MYSNVRATIFMFWVLSSSYYILKYFEIFRTEVQVFKPKLGVQLWCFISTIFNLTIHSIFELHSNLCKHKSFRGMLGLYFSYWRFRLVLAHFWFTKLWILETFTEKLNFQLSLELADFYLSFSLYYSIALENLSKEKF